jgi:8-oxo-dGTP diphosphatase
MHVPSRSLVGVRDWVGGGALLLDGDELLLVQNRRPHGATDWTPPGGVIDVQGGETLLDGLTREVEEETGLRVTEWATLLWSVTAEAPGLGWRLSAEIHLARSWEGELRVADPDGIVVDARFVPCDACGPCLADGHPWVREPLTAWLAERWEDARPFDYRVDGDDVRAAVVSRV